MRLLLLAAFLVALSTSVPSAAAQARRSVPTTSAVTPSPARPAVTRGANPVADSSFEATYVTGTNPPVKLNPFWESQSSQFGSPFCMADCPLDPNSTFAVPRTGDWYVWFGGAGEIMGAILSESAAFSQAVSLPTPTATLRFWMRIPNQSPPYNADFEVRLGDTAGLNTDSLLTVVTYADQPGFGDYRQVVLPVRSTGVPQLLSFAYQSVPGTNTSFFIDDVTLGPPVPGALLVADGRQFPSPPFTLAVASGSLLFGEVQTGAQTVRTVSLTNLGADPAVVGDITFAGQPGVTATIDRSDLPAQIPPGGQAQFDVALTTTVLGPVSGTLSVESNTPGPPATLAVEATGISTTVQTFCAGAAVDLPAGPPSVYAGLAGPYPSTVTVAGVTDPVIDVTVQLLGVSHGVPRHIDLGLVHPRGPSLVLLSGVGTATPTQNAAVTLSDEGSNALWFAAPLQTGTFRPTNVSVGDAQFPAPAPFIPTDQSFPLLSAFDALDPNGVWQLFGRDIEAIGPAFNDQGGMTDWCVALETTNSGASGGCEQSLAATLDDPTPAPGQIVTFTTTVTNAAASVAPFDLTLTIDGPLSRQIHLGRGRVLAGGTVTRDVRLRFPPNAPNGTYTLTLTLGGPSAGAACDAVSFRVTVSGGAATLAAASSAEFELVQGFTDAALEREGALGTGGETPVTAAPNPFTRQTVLTLAVPAPGDARLAVYDVLGREVAVLVDGPVEAGVQRVVLDAADLTAGTYVYRLVMGGTVQTGQITLVR